MFNLNLEYAKSLTPKAALFTPDAINALNNIKSKECVGAEWTDWYNWPQEQGFSLLKEIHSWKNSNIEFYDCILLLGIGGSFAGVQAVEKALNHSLQGHRLAVGLKTRHLPIFYAGNNLSNSELSDTMEVIEHKNPLMVVISKSGTTLETNAAYRIINEQFKQRYSEEQLCKRTIIITDKSQGILREIATRRRIKSFVIPDGVGGRYSVLSAVGMVPLSLAGFDVDSIMEGGHKLYRELNEATKEQLEENPVIQLACLRMAAWQDGQRIDLLSINEPKLEGFYHWWRQLFAESEGKEKKGMFPCGAIYSTDLHSLGQFVQEGTRNIFETFLTVNYNNSSTYENNYSIPQNPICNEPHESSWGHKLTFLNETAIKGTIEAHRDGGIPCPLIEVSALNSFNLGYLFAYFQVVCGVSAALLGVNAYNQPGVEIYKRNIKDSLSKSI